MCIRPNINIFFTILAIAVSFAWLGVDDPSQWRAGIALYIIGCEYHIPIKFFFRDEFFQ